MAKSQRSIEERISKKEVQYEQIMVAIIIFFSSHLHKGEESEKINLQTKCH